MKRYYSPSENSFPQEGLLSNDVILISEEEFLTLLNAQEKGMCIQPDKSGYPIAVNPIPPSPTYVELAAQRIAEIQKQLTANDLASVRPLRAKVAGTATAEDEARLVELEEQAQALRAELAEVSA